MDTAVISSPVSASIAITTLILQHAIILHEVYRKFTSRRELGGRKLALTRLEERRAIAETSKKIGGFLYVDLQLSNQEIYLASANTG